MREIIYLVTLWTGQALLFCALHRFRAIGEMHLKILHQESRFHMQTNYQHWTGDFDVFESLPSSWPLLWKFWLPLKRTEKMALLLLEAKSGGVFRA